RPEERADATNCRGKLPRPQCNTGTVTDANTDNGSIAMLKTLKNCQLARWIATIMTELPTSKTNIELVGGLYQELLGRAPDEHGLKCHINALSDGMTLEDVRNSILASEEYKTIERKASISDLWGITAKKRQKNPIMGWLDSPLVLRWYVQP